jgi:hypothetical protein
MKGGVSITLFLKVIPISANTVSYKIFTRFFYIGLMIFIYLIGINGLVYAAKPAEKDWPKSATVSFDGQLRFHLLGAPGFYPAVQPIRCLIRANEPVQIQFSATPLSYVSNDSQESSSLTVVYWINRSEKDHLSFTPQGMPLTLYKDLSQNCCEEFLLYGGVTIDHIDGQSAGLYQGTIYVTVSAKEGRLN